MSFQREREKNGIFRVEINGTYPDLTAANQLLFHLGKGQEFFSPKLYTFSIPHVAMAPYIVKIT